MRDRSSSLDLLRGLAALFVMMGHLRTILFVPFQDLTDRGIINSATWFVTGFGHECVIMFFVLSGFFVGAAWDRNFSASTVGELTKSYSLNRLTRLWMVLIPSLVFTLIIDLAGIALTKHPEIYSTSDYFQFIKPSNDRSVVTFFGNVFFLQTIFVPTFGTNTPLWSLACEFWYYVMFPMGYILFVKEIRVLNKVIVGLLLAGMLVYFYLLDYKFVEGFVIWLLGFGAYRMKNKPNILIMTGAIAVFIVILAAARGQVLSVYTDIVLGVATAVLIVAIRHRSLGVFNPVAEFLSKISYTLYLFHIPLITFVAATIFYGDRFQGGVVNIAIFVAMCLAIIAFSYAMYYLFERRTDDVKKRLKYML